VTVGYSQTQGALLEESYKKNSAELLKQFFLNWNQEIKTITNDELLNSNDTVNQAYQAFTAFYKPHSIGSIGGSEWGNDIYSNVDFLIVQNFIKIYFTNKIHFSEQELEDYMIENINKHVKTDSIREKYLTRKNGKFQNITIEMYGPDGGYYSNREKVLTDSIVDFRPRIDCDGKIPLYLTENYRDLLNAFLGNNHLPLGAGGIMNPARSKGQSEKRQKFLSQNIKIWYGHWGGYWQLYSYPQAYSITFDKDMQYAKINFRMIYEGGEAILKNNNGEWTVLSARRTWIE
jgi:hypothetical protein